MNWKPYQRRFVLQWLMLIHSLHVDVQRTSVWGGGVQPSMAQQYHTFLLPRLTSIAEHGAIGVSRQEDWDDCYKNSLFWTHKDVALTKSQQQWSSSHSTSSLNMNEAHQGSTPSWRAIDSRWLLEKAVIFFNDAPDRLITLQRIASYPCNSG